MKNRIKKAALTAVLGYCSVVGLGFGMLRAAQQTRRTLYGGTPVMAQITQRQSPGAAEITLGGGECTAQPEAALSLLQAAKQEGINTAIETCGYCKKETILKLAEFVDLFLFDIKHFDSDRHSELTGVRNEIILDNLATLLEGRHNVQVRMPMLKGVNDSQEEIENTMEFLLPYKDLKNFKGIDLLPYHKMGVNKYGQLDMEYAITDEVKLEQEDLDRIEGWISKYDLPVSVIRH